jgi:hypothetical protein
MGYAAFGLQMFKNAVGLDAKIHSMYMLVYCSLEGL